MKLKGDIFKDQSDKLKLLWTNDQWQTVMDAMEEYADQVASERAVEFNEWTAKKGIKPDSRNEQGEMVWYKYNKASHNIVGTTKDIYKIFNESRSKQQ